MPDSNALPPDIQDTPNADPQAVKEFWLQCAKGAEAKGKLETLPTVKATTPRQVDVARKQNAALTRKVFMMPDNGWYERIFGGKASD